MWRVVLTIAIATALLALGGSEAIGGETASGPDSTATASSAADGAGSNASAAHHGQPTAQARRRSKLTLIGSRFGRMLADGKGNALYVFTRDKSDSSRCRGDCAHAWPPLKTRRMPTAGSGVRKKLLGITRRRNGSKQVTYNGKPLYYYAHEGAPGTVGCQNVLSFDGRWFVANKKGKAIT